MKAPTLHSFLEECRAAKTSNEIGLVVDQIETKIGTMRAERAKSDGQLQEAIVAGRDPGKIHTAIAQLDQDLMTLEAARSGFSQKQADARKLEDADAKNALIGKHRQQSDELEAATKEFAAAGEKMRAVGAKLAALAKQHERTVGELEALVSDTLAERQASSATRSAKSGAVMVSLSTAGGSISGWQKCSRTIPALCAALRICAVVALARPTRRGTWRLRAG
jgi:hypothetical protein